MSPCVADPHLDTKIGGAQMCDNFTACATDKLTYVEGIYTTQGLTDLNPIGIAKDGYIIYGPYNAAG